MKSEKEEVEVLVRRLAWVLLRRRSGWNKSQLAAALQLGPSAISNYEGEGSLRLIPKTLLAQVAKATDFPRPLLRRLLAELRSFVTVSEHWPRLERLMDDSRVAELAAIAGDAVELILSPIASGEHLVPHTPRSDDRLEAQALWTRVMHRSHRQLLALVEETEEFRSWALIECIALASITAAADSPRKALELAELALRIAELCPGPDTLRWKLIGYALAHVANARRVQNDLVGAEKEITEAWRLWEAGGADDHGLLSEVWLWWIEATLRDAQRRFGEAQDALGRALALDQGELRGKLLLTKAQILTAQDDRGASIEVLKEALALVDAKAEPRTAMALLFQIVVNLCHEDRVPEASALMPAVQEAARRLDQKMDTIRVRWLEGLVAGGLGEVAAAIGAFEEVRSEFASRTLPYDYALATLDLAFVLLTEGRNQEVRGLAESMLVHSNGVHPEALAALEMFCETAKREAVTIHLIREVAAYLTRAKRDPAFGSPGPGP